MEIFHKSGVLFHSETIVYSPVRLVSCEGRNVVKNISSKQPTYVYVIAWIKERRRSEFIIRKSLFIISKMLKVKLHSIFFQLCLSVCLSACLSVCLSVLFSPFPCVFNHGSSIFLVAGTDITSLGNKEI